MELIERYVAEVGRHLPEQMRSDIEAEIRSLLEDNLEDRSHQQGRQPDEEMVVEVLKAYGKPEKVAATYLPPRYLIGPRMYPTFLMVIRIMLLVLMIVTLVQFGVAVGLAGGGLAHIGLSLLEAAGTFISGGLTALGVIVIVFAILQWKFPHQGGESESEDWDPHKLERVTLQTERVKTGSLIVETILSVVMLLALIFYSDRIGLYALVDGQWEFAPLLTRAFYNLLPWIAAVWGLDILLNLVVLRQGRWQPVTRWLSAGIGLLNIVLLLFMLAGAPIIDITPRAMEVLANWNIGPEAAGGLGMALGMAVRIALTVMLIISAVELGGTVYRLVRGKTAGQGL